MKSLLTHFLLVFTLSLMVVSCSMEKRHHRDGFHVQLFKKNQSTYVSTQWKNVEKQSEEHNALVKVEHEKSEVIQREEKPSKKEEEHHVVVASNSSASHIELVDEQEAIDFEDKALYYADDKEDQPSDPVKNPKERKNWLGAIGGFFSAFGFFSFLVGVILTGQPAVSAELTLGLGVIAPPILIGLGLMMVAASFLIMRNKKQSKRTKKSTIINQIAGYVAGVAYMIMIASVGIFSAIAFPAGWSTLSVLLLVALGLAIAGALLLNLVHVLMKIGGED